jgi:hypothetical protein
MPHEPILRSLFFVTKIQHVIFSLANSTKFIFRFTILKIVENG